MNAAELARAAATCRTRIRKDPNDVDAMYALALLRKADDPGEAIDLFGRCLSLQAGRTDILFERANLFRSIGRGRDAVRDYRDVLNQDPSHFRALANLGNALRDFGHYEAAVECYERAIRAGGDLPPVRLNKAIALHKMGQPEKSLDMLAELSAGEPDFAESWFEQARMLGELRRHDEAFARYAQGFALEPHNVRALNSRGNLLASLFRMREAMVDFDLALQLSPQFHEALNNRANLLRNMGRFGDALGDYDRALALRPNVPEVLINRGNVLRDLSRFEEALDSLQRAIDINPKIATAYMHGGRIFTDLGRVQQADELFDRALALKPDFWECWFYKGAGLRELGAHAEALQCFRRILEANPDDVNLASLGNYLFSMNFDDGTDAEGHLVQARLFGQLVARRVTERYSHAWPQASPRELNVGFVSGDLHTHPVGFFLQNVFRHLGHSRLRLFAYANNGEHDSVSDELKSACVAWNVVTGMSDRQLAKKIHDDKIHVLFDLSGHTDKSRLPAFAWKPAPVQVTWLGYCASTGLEEIDFVLGDAVVTPLAEQGAFVEKIWQLPESYFCFSPPATNLSVASLPALANGYVTFGCFNKLSKMSDAVVSVWARILKAMPDAKLLLKSAVLADAATRNETLRRFARHGVPAQRLQLQAATDYQGYLAAYSEVDIALDPFPYPGATTTLEGLWMGVPCITMTGRRFLARNGETIAIHTGLGDFIARDPNDYVDRAVRIASDIRALADLRSGLRERVRQSALFDGARFAVHFEQAVFGMWDAARRGQRIPGSSA